MKRARRDWAWARMKVESEGRCRVCQSAGQVDAAHVLGRKYDSNDGVVQPDDVIPLCRSCHEKYDLRKLGVLPYLSLEEQAAAVRLVGIVRTLRRVDPS